MKGIIDVMLIGILLFVIAVSIVVSYALVNKTSQVVQEQGLSNSNISSSLTGIINVFKSLDYVFAFITVSLMILAVVLARNIPTHAMFFVMSVIALIVTILINVVISNAYYEFAGVDAISAYSNDFPLMSKIILNLPLISLIESFLIIIAMYSAPSEMSGGYGY